MFWYTDSLSSGGMYSLNYLRLHALQNIELVVNERKIYGNNSPIKRLGERRATQKSDSITREWEGRSKAESVLK